MYNVSQYIAIFRNVTWTMRGLPVEAGANVPYETTAPLSRRLCFVLK
jgi:hypothetical protein